MQPKALVRPIPAALPGVVAMLVHPASGVRWQERVSEPDATVIHPVPLFEPRRGNPQKWLRRIHAWLGMALALMLLLFAVTGFLLNHRAVMKIPALQREEVTQILALEAVPADPSALAQMLAPALGLESRLLSPRIEPARTLQWGGNEVVQPERWTLRADAPSETVQVEFWLGNRSVEVRRTKPNAWLYLARLHMAIGTGPSWVLLSDAAAIALAFLALSGFLLWGRLHGPRLRLVLLAGGGALSALGLAWLAG